MVADSHFSENHYALRMVYSRLPMNYTGPSTIFFAPGDQRVMDSIDRRESFEFLGRIDRYYTYCTYTYCMRIMDRVPNLPDTPIFFSAVNFFPPFTLLRLRLLFYLFYFFVFQTCVGAYLNEFSKHRNRFNSTTHVYP